MTLSARIYLLVSLAVAPAFLLLVYNHHQSVQREEVNSEQQALRSTWHVSAELDQIFKGVENLLRAASQTPMVGNFQNPDCSNYLARLEGVNEGAGWLIAVDGQGRVRCGRNPENSSVADRDYFREAMATDELVVGTYTIGRASGVPILPLALRVQTSEGPGLLIAGVRLEWLRNHFAGRFARLPQHSSLTIVDKKGVILVRLPNSDREGAVLTNYAHVVHAAEPGTFRSTADKNADGIARFLGYTPVGSPPLGVAIAVGYPQEAALAQLQASAVRNYLLLGLVACLAFLAAALGGRSFIRQPISELLATIGRWRGGDLSARVMRTTDRSELDQLGLAFNSLADDLEAALKHKDVLLRELSHRMMNSLSTISSMLKLQSRTMRATEAKSEFQEAIGRIDALAHAYRRMQATTGGAVEFSSFLADLGNDLKSSMMEGKGSCIVKADTLKLSPEQAIPLSLIVNELVTNAIKHGAPGSKPIFVQLESLPEHCRLSIRNAGSLPEGYVAAQSKGFGMRMVDTMVRQLHGDLEVASVNGETEFAVIFKPTVAHSAAYQDDARTGRAN